MSRFAIGLVLFMFHGLAALALDVPKLQNRVTDLAGVLTPEQTASLEAKLQEFERTDSTQVAVLIIPSLEGDSLEDYSMRVAEAWKLGQKGRDNGAIVLIARQDRKIRIEVGYGLEPTLTDARTAQIRLNDMNPRFKEGDFYGGIDAGVTGIIQTVRGVYQASPEYEKQPSRRRSGGSLFNFLIVMLFPLFWILSATGKWGGAIIGAGAGMLLPYTLISHSWILLLIGGAVGGLLGVFMGALIRSGSHSGRGPSGFAGPFFWGGGGGFSGGGGFGGGGGFSGGGGGFGGGGSSGSW